uniref:Secreted protein n=1 Tax=Rhizophora mucronata TaxID=61149 RepID=A0A2P2QMG9_RHIMU
MSSFSGFMFWYFVLLFLRSTVKWEILGIFGLRSVCFEKCSGSVFWFKVLLSPCIDAVQLDLSSRSKLVHLLSIDSFQFMFLKHLVIVLLAVRKLINCFGTVGGS